MLSTDQKSHYFHGFLGESNQYNSIGLVGHNLYELSELSDSQIIRYLQDNTPQDSKVIAYSLGARFVFKYYQDFFKDIESIYILSGNPLKGYNQKDFDFYLEVVSRLISSNQKEFLTWWNSIPLFANDLPISSKRSTKEILRLFVRWPKYLQSDYSSILTQENIKQVYAGEYDKKYLNIYSKLNIDSKLKTVKGGHRIINSDIVNDIQSLSSGDQI